MCQIRGADGHDPLAAALQACLLSRYEAPIWAQPDSGRLGQSELPCLATLVRVTQHSQRLVYGYTTISTRRHYLEFQGLSCRRRLGRVLNHNPSLAWGSACRSVAGLPIYRRLRCSTMRSVRDVQGRSQHTSGPAARLAPSYVPAAGSEAADARAGGEGGRGAPAALALGAVGHHADVAAARGRPGVRRSGRIPRTVERRVRSVFYAPMQRQPLSVLTPMSYDAQTSPICKRRTNSHREPRDQHLPNTSPEPSVFT